MSIVTLCSDLGSSNYQLAALKGSLLGGGNMPAQFTDIAHDIHPFDLVEAAFHVANSYPYFPPGTIHLLLVNPFYGENARIIVIERNEQFFIAPDNGLLSLVFEENPPLEAICLPAQDTTPALYRQLGLLIGKLQEGKNLIELGEPVKGIQAKITLRPVMNRDSIRGSIIYIDHFGNLITNIRKEQFDRTGNGRSFAIFYKHKDPITQINRYYHEVAVGEELCLFNMDGYLEIAVCMGNAHTILGLDLDDSVQIDFYQS